jgi:hypothetical protein
VWVYQGPIQYAVSYLQRSTATRPERVARIRTLDAD